MASPAPPAPAPPTAEELRDARARLAATTLKDFAVRRDAARAAEAGGGGGTAPVPREVITLPSDSSLEAALSTLAERDILSAPILDKRTGDYLGFFSLADALRWMLHGLFPALLSPSLGSAAEMAAFVASDEGRALLTVDLTAWARDGFLSEHCVRPGCPPDGDAVWAGFPGATMLDLVSHALCRRAAGDARRGDFEPSHRVAVFDVDSADAGARAAALPTAVRLPGARPPPLRVVDIVSQSDVVRTLAAPPDALGALGGMALGRLFGPKQVLCVPASLPAVAAFALMHTCDISGVGVVDDGGEGGGGEGGGGGGGGGSGALVAELAVPDLRALRCSADFDRFLLPSVEFARQRTSGQPGPAVVALRQGDTLRAAVDALVAHKVHRVYTVDGAGRPDGVVTLTDVLRLLAVDPEDDAEGWLTW